MEHLINMVRFVEGHVFDLEMYVVVGKLGMRAAAVPFGWAEFRKALGEALSIFKEAGQ